MPGPTYTLALVADATRAFVKWALFSTIGADPNATYVLQSADAALPNSFVATAGSGITLTPSGGLLTISASSTGAGTGIYGDGSDGTATCDGSTGVVGMSLSGGNYFLSRDVYFANLTINGGVTVDGNGFRCFCNGPLTLNGHYGVDGGDGGGGTITGTQGLGGGGGLNNNNSAVNGGYPGGGGGTSMCLGGYGSTGDGVYGSPGGNNPAVPPVAAMGGWRDLRTISGVLIGTAQNPTDLAITGGAGGQHGNRNGTCEGGGGGCAYLIALTLQGSGTVTSNGGKGGVCTSYPLLGGCGGGGFVMLVTRNSSGWTGSISVAGGPSYSYGGYTIPAGGAGTILRLTA